MTDRDPRSPRADAHGGAPPPQGERRRGRFWVTLPHGAPPEERPPSYARLAEVYDDALGEPFHTVFWPVLQDALSRHVPPGRRAVDLGCGTGILALRLAHEGWFVTGVDASAEMLRIAREKVERSGALVDLLEADIRHFTLREPADAAFAAYDTLNHVLTSQDLVIVFRRIAENLRPGGLLFADMNCRAAFRDIWGDPEPFVRQGPGYRLEIRSSFDVDSRLGTARVKVWEGPDLSEHPEEEVRQRYFLDEEIRGTLWAGGLDPIDRIPFDILPPEDRAEEPMKALWVARKRPRPDAP